MALIVEDGTGLNPLANGYISVVELDAYWSCRNVTLSQTDPEKEAAIIIATQYVDLNNKWKGTIAMSDQPLDWPRVAVVDDEGRVIPSFTIPNQLKNAVAEYAKRQLSAPIQPDVTDEGALKKTKKKVDVIEVETEYQDNTGGYFGIRSYPLADNYLIGLIRGGVGGNFGRIGVC
jgi:hypothetical protein